MGSHCPVPSAGPAQAMAFPVAPKSETSTMKVDLTAHSVNAEGPNAKDSAGKENEAGSATSRAHALELAQGHRQRHWLQQTLRYLGWRAAQAVALRLFLTATWHLVLCLHSLPITLGAFCQDLQLRHIPPLAAMLQDVLRTGTAPESVPFPAFAFACGLLMAIALLLGMLLAMTRGGQGKGTPVYLLDFACYKAPPELTASAETFFNISEKCGKFTPENLEFQKKIYSRSGLGDKTYLPRGILSIPCEISMDGARAEAEQVMFGAVEEVLARTGVRPEEIGVLVVNCSLFCPTPSLSAMIVNRFQLRQDIKSFNLGGMGCSAGVIAADLAADMLRLHAGSSKRCQYALVVSTENITQNWYFGNDRAKLLPNCLFRVGGAAVLLSARPADRRRAKYELVHTVRTHMGADPHSFRCVYQEEDEQGTVGVSLSKDLMAVAGRALRANITTLGPLVLPLSEKIWYGAVLFARKVLKMKGLKPYTPDFKKAFKHFCVHAGGRGVLDEVEKCLQLSTWHLEPSRMTLQRFGNTSSSSIWYELAFCEASGRMRRGDRVWQIAFGSGFKCNSAVWKALRSSSREGSLGVWEDTFAPTSTAPGL